MGMTPFWDPAGPYARKGNRGALAPQKGACCPPPKGACWPNRGAGPPKGLLGGPALSLQSVKRLEYQSGATRPGQQQPLQHLRATTGHRNVVPPLLQGRGGSFMPMRP
jgi:hypothetical protein